MTKYHKKKNKITKQNRHKYTQKGGLFSYKYKKIYIDINGFIIEKDNIALEPIDFADFIAIMRMLKYKIYINYNDNLINVISRLLSYIIQMCGYYIYLELKKNKSEDKINGIENNIFILLYILSELFYKFDQKDQLLLQSIINIGYIDSATLQNNQENNTHIFNECFRKIKTSKKSEGLSKRYLCDQRFDQLFINLICIIKKIINHTIIYKHFLKINGKIYFDARNYQLKENNNKTTTNEQLSIKKLFQNIIESVGLKLQSTNNNNFSDDLQYRKFLLTQFILKLHKKEKLTESEQQFIDNITFSSNVLDQLLSLDNNILKKTQLNNGNTTTV